MPIYAYRCESCGFEKDVLQKLSDAPLSQCPECGRETFRKQVTAAGFQLKGSGWYVTDFRGGSKPGGNNQSGGGEGDAKAAPVAKEAGSADGAASAGASTAGAATAPAATGSAAPSSNAGTSA